MINQDIRRRAEQALGLQGEVPEAIWTYLTQNGAVAAVERGKQDINWLTDELWKLLEASGLRRRLLEAPRMLSSGQRERAESREAMLAILCWDEARRDRAVSEFRGHVLNGELLLPNEVEDWMTRQAASDGSPTVWLWDLPVPEGFEVIHDRRRGVMFTKPSLAVGLKHAARSGGLRYLACIPGIAFPTAKDGVLERVRQISQTLAQRFSWNPLQATLFLLYG